MNPTDPPGFQPHVHRLRGIAILMIVALHCVSFFSWERHPLEYKLLRELFDNSTVLFMVISGYLFQHLSAGFDYREYLGRKFRNVILPYMIVVTPAIVYAIWRTDLGHSVQALRGTSMLYEAAWLSLYPGMLVDYALWFIPVIGLFYLAAPLLLAIDRHPRGYLILVPLIAISLLGHRPTYSSGHNLQLAAYFLSCYVFGMYMSSKRQTSEPMIQHRLGLFLAAFLILFIGHFVLVDHAGNYQVSNMFSFEHGLIDWLYLQKMLLVVVLLGTLKLVDRVRFPALAYIAQISFTIYFVHLYVLFLIRVAFHWKVFEGNMLSWLIVYSVTLVGSCCVAEIMHRIFNRRRAPTVP